MRVRVSTLYRVVVADPAWMFGDKLGKRGAGAKYRCEALEAIKRHKLPPLADDCVLFLWKVSSMQEEAFEVARAWGFQPTKGEICWRKLTITGRKEHFGMGRIVRGSHESCIIATRGRPRPLHRRQRSLFSAPTPEKDRKAQHSAKPDEFFRIVRELFAGPRISLFERKQREGFVCWGDEMERGEGGDV